MPQGFAIVIVRTKGLRPNGKHRTTTHLQLIRHMVTCGRTKRARVRSPLGSISWLRFFRGYPSGNLGHIRPWLSYGHHISSKPCVISPREATVRDLSYSTWPSLNNNHLHGLGHKSWQLFYFMDICERITNVHVSCGMSAGIVSHSKPKHPPLHLVELTVSCQS